jgi:DNA repair exonuclease SbcCD nuclease subunit
MRFVQLSDAHLGAPSGATALALPPEKRDPRRRELTDALCSACDLAWQGRGAAMILLPGDLRDHTGVSRGAQLPVHQPPRSQPCA